MRINSRAFGLAAGTMAAMLFTLCAVAVAIAPSATTALASTLIHLDLSGMSRTITLASFVIGLVSWTLASGLVFYGVGGLYNRYASRVPMMALPEGARRIA